MSNEPRETRPRSASVGDAPAPASPTHPSPAHPSRGHTTPAQAPPVNAKAEEEAAVEDNTVAHTPAGRRFSARPHPGTAPGKEFASPDDLNSQGTPAQEPVAEDTATQNNPPRRVVTRGMPPRDVPSLDMPSADLQTRRPRIQGAPMQGAENANDDHAASFADLDLNLLVVFDAVMQDRSLTRAARRLGLSQPATSHALARLRTVLHDPLFVRAPDGMRPTPRAQQIAGQVREALRLLRITLEPERFDPAQSQRRFTLVVNSYAARTIVPGLTRRLAEQAPGIMLDVRPIGRLEALDSLDADGADLALTVLGDGGERFKCVRVAEDDYVAVLDRNHPAAQMRVLTAERLAAMPHIELTSTGNDTSFVDRLLADRGLTRRVAVRVPSVSSTLLMVNSDYITVLPRRVATDLAAICPLVVKDLPFASPWLVLSMIWHRRLDTHPAQRWLREAVREVGQAAPVLAAL